MKRGDTVRVKRGNYESDIGVIVEEAIDLELPCESCSKIWRVEFEDGTRHAISEDDLELIKASLFHHLYR
jgi:hypothetical protein